jgi:creatinine amidohydrolase/Fe(II)-dependent formamide hydrolase-like protein
MFIDKDHQWVRKDKPAPDHGTMGVQGDPIQASTELGKMFIEFKIKNAVTQIRSFTVDKR